MKETLTRDECRGLLSLALMLPDEIRAASDTETRFVLLGHWVRINERARHFAGYAGPVMAWSEDASEVQVRWGMGDECRVWLPVDQVSSLDTTPLRWTHDQVAEYRRLADRWRALWDESFDLETGSDRYAAIMRRAQRIKWSMGHIARAGDNSAGLVP
jgi:hypothetical protein